MRACPWEAGRHVPPPPGAAPVALQEIRRPDPSSTPQAADSRTDAASVHIRHLDVLDGWRGVSILLVLLAHLFPLGFVGNATVGLAGMALFFSLSGFLITSYLLTPQAALRVFVIRRLARIVPLAWTYLAIVFFFQKETADSIVAHFLFYANLPPKYVHLATDHFWSLCVEMQFYAGIALLFALLRARGLYLLPVLGLAFTLLRVHDGAYASSITWFRVDEILAGCTLALLHKGRFGKPGDLILRWLAAAPPGLLLVLLYVTCRFEGSEGTGPNYLRPYVSALLVGATLCNPRSWLANALRHRTLLYLASISYALYVIHFGLLSTWLGTGDLIEKYAKRPLLLAVLFVLAHASTFHLEHRFIELGKRAARRFSGTRKPVGA